MNFFIAETGCVGVLMLAACRVGGDLQEVCSRRGGLPRRDLGIRHIRQARLAAAHVIRVPRVGHSLRRQRCLERARMRETLTLHVYAFGVAVERLLVAGRARREAHKVQDGGI